MTVVINGTTGIDTGTGSLIAADATTPTYLDLFEDTDNGSNYVRLIAPTSIAANRTLTLPDSTGTVVVGSAAVSAIGQIPFSTDGSTYTPTAKIVSDTVKTATGSSVEFTGIPSWVKRITVMFYDLSTTSTNAPRVQLGTASSYETSGYSAGATAVSGSPVWGGGSNIDGFLLTGQVAASTQITGALVLTNITGNVWVAALAGNNPAGSAICGGGYKSLGGVLTRLQLIPSLGTFDLGSINILYE